MEYLPAKSMLHSCSLPWHLCFAAAHAGAVWLQLDCKRREGDKARYGKQELWQLQHQANIVLNCKEQHGAPSGLWALLAT